MTRASTVLFWFSLTILISLGLYHTSYRVEDLGRKLRSLNASIEMEQRNIHVLKAEWVYLSNPARIEAAARKHLDLKPTSPQQVAQQTRLIAMLPTHNEMLAGAVMSAKPIASLNQRPATHTPKAVAEESGRLNTRMIIQKTAQAQSVAAEEAALSLSQESTIALANSGDEP